MLLVANRLFNDIQSTGIDELAWKSPLGKDNFIEFMIVYDDREVDLIRERSEFVISREQHFLSHGVDVERVLKF